MLVLDLDFNKMPEISCVARARFRRTGARALRRGTAPPHHAVFRLRPRALQPRPEFRRPERQYLRWLWPSGLPGPSGAATANSLPLCWHVLPRWWRSALAHRFRGSNHMWSFPFSSWPGSSPGMTMQMIGFTDSPCYRIGPARDLMNEGHHVRQRKPPFGALPRLVSSYAVSSRYTVSGRASGQKDTAMRLSLTPEVPDTGFVPATLQDMLRETG